ncbi:MAG TPA: hypothetical protein VMS17_15975 [Gemmataceae bacterium]|nr:hypothetical protein [Gemmataceae bacterium]
MIFWVREIAGWALILLGLAAFWAVVDMGRKYEYEDLPQLAIPIAATTVIGIFLFRGGIHLLKVAVAARMCREVQGRLYPDARVGSPPLPAARTPGRAGWRS